MTQEHLRTEIVYLVTRDRSFQLDSSLYSLLKSNTQFDSIRIIWIDSPTQKPRYRNSRIVEVFEESLDPDFFMLNKTKIAINCAHRTVFLDTDTFVISPLHVIWDDQEVDIIARPASRYLTKDFNVNAWQEELKKVGAQQESPYFNSGFVVFNNQSLKRIADDWIKYTNDLFNKNMPFSPDDYHCRKNSNQLALSLAIAANNLTFKQMTHEDQFYCWYDNELLQHINNIKLVHTSGGSYYSKYSKVLQTLLGLPISFRLHTILAEFGKDRSKLVREFKHHFLKVYQESIKPLFLRLQGL